MLTTNAIVNVNAYTGSTTKPAQADRNGKMPVIMTPFKGSVPNRAMVITGTVAERAGIETGNSYLVQFREIESNEYGRQFRHTNLGKIDAIDLATRDFSALGEANIIDVSKSAEAKAQAEEDIKADGNPVMTEDSVGVTRQSEATEIV